MSGIRKIKSVRKSKYYVKELNNMIEYLTQIKKEINHIYFEHVTWRRIHWLVREIEHAVPYLRSLTKGIRKVVRQDRWCVK